MQWQRRMNCALSIDPIRLHSYATRGRADHTCEYAERNEVPDLDLMRECESSEKPGLNHSQALRHDHHLVSIESIGEHSGERHYDQSRKLA